MGVIYKLTPEVKNWIVAQKRANPRLSCRNMIALVNAEFKVKVSKSSINSLFKEAGLSMPVGRRQRKAEPKPPLSATTLKTEHTKERPKALTGPKAKKLLPELPPKPEVSKEIPLPPPPLESTGQAIAKIPEKASEKTPEPKEKPQDRISEKAPEKVPEQPKEKATERPPEQTPKKPAEKTPTKAPDKPLEKIPEIPIEKAHERPLEKAQREPGKEAVKTPLEKISEKIPEETRQIIPGKTPEGIQKKISERTPQKAHEKVPEKPSEPPEKAPEIPKEKMLQKLPEQKPKRTPEPKKTPERPPEEISKKSQEKAGEKTPEKAPERAPEKAPEKTPGKPPKETPTPAAPKEPKIPPAPQPTVPTPAAPAPPTPQPKAPPEAVSATGPQNTLHKALSSGAILLKAADYLIGGSHHIYEIIKKHLNTSDRDILAKIESLIYTPFLKTLGAPLDAYLKELKTAEACIPDILDTLSLLLTPVRCVKFLLSNGEPLYLDGQLHTVWSVPHIPYDFNNTAHNIKSCITKTFSEDKPLILFMAPGYDRPTADFYKFIASLGYGKSQITGASLYSNSLRQSEFIKVEQYKKHFLIFGMWPWQFSEYRRVKKIGEFKPFDFQGQRNSFYVADIMLELTEPEKDSKLLLPGCALKNGPAEKTRLLIATNMPEGTPPEHLASLYLNRWPNLEEAFQDYSRKVELFTYTASSRKLFSPEAMNLEPKIYDMEHLLEYYLKVLDLYFKWHFLPSGYIEKDFSVLLEQFYRAKMELKSQDSYSLATFQLPPESNSAKALKYACRRLNEREITLNEQKKLWFGL